MDKLIIMLLGMATLFGCKSSSLSSKVDKEVVESIVEQDSLVIKTNKKVDWKELVSSMVSIIIEEIEYDTNKNVDTITSLPPVKSKKTISIDRKETKDRSNNIDEVVDDFFVREYRNDSTYREKVDSKEELNKKSPLKYIKSILWAIAVLVILFLGYRIYRKR